MDRRNPKFYLGPRQGVLAPPLSPTCLLDFFPKGDQAFLSVESPGLLPATCTTSSARCRFLLQCLRALGRNTPVWPGSGYLALHPQPCHGGCPQRRPRAQASSSGHPRAFREDLALPTAGMEQPPASRLRGGRLKGCCKHCKPFAQVFLSLPEEVQGCIS